MRLLLALLVFLGACQLVAPLPSQCETDGDCSASQVCARGKCLDAQSLGCQPVCPEGRCGPDGCGGFCAGCGKDEACEGGSCVARCDKKSRCEGRCDTATGSCACASSADCLGGLVCDAQSHACVACTSRDDCPTHMECVGGRCGKCLSDDACRGNTRDGRVWCDQGSGACAACDGAHPCGSGERCLAGECEPAARCHQNADCTDPGAPACRAADTSEGVCVRCLQDHDCPAGGKCVGESCTGSDACLVSDDCRGNPKGQSCGAWGPAKACGCEANADCEAGGARPYCLVDGHQCVACRTGADCPGGQACDAASHTCQQAAAFRVGQRCTNGGECGTGEECRWFAGPAGMCVHSYPTQTACQQGCASSDVSLCIADPDAAGSFLCTKRCSATSSCPPALACTSGACSPVCASAGDGCSSLVQGSSTTLYSCQGSPLRCAQSTGAQPAGGQCQSAADCQAGLSCAFDTMLPASFNQARCRPTCAATDVLCTGGTACLVPQGGSKGVCALGGSVGDGAPCGSSDECSPGLLCLRGVSGASKCRKACDPNAPPAGCEAVCAPFGPGSASSACDFDLHGSPQGGPPWCPVANPAAAERCDFCDEDGNGQIDENVSVVGMTPPEMLSASYTDVDSTVPGKPVSPVTVRLGGTGAGFLTVYLGDFSDRVQLTFHVSQQRGYSTEGLLTTVMKNGRPLVPGRKLAVAGPFGSGPSAYWYVAYRLFADDTVTVRRFQLQTAPPAFDASWSRTLTASSNPPQHVQAPRLVQLGGQLVALVQGVDTPGQIYAMVPTLSGAGLSDPQGLMLGTTGAITDFDAAAAPDLGAGAIYAVYAQGTSVRGHKITVNGAGAPSGSAAATLFSGGANFVQAGVVATPGAHELVVVAATATQVRAMGLDAQLAASGGLLFPDTALGPFALAAGGLTGDFALLALFDTSSHASLVAAFDPAASRPPDSRPYGPSSVPWGDVPTLAHDGVRLSLGGTYPDPVYVNGSRTGLFVGCQ